MLLRQIWAYGKVRIRNSICSDQNSNSSHPDALVVDPFFALSFFFSHTHTFSLSRLPALASM